MTTRRLFLVGGGAGLASLLAAHPILAAETFEITRTDAEWRKLLTPDQYAVLRQEDGAPLGPLLHENRRAHSRARDAISTSFPRPPSSRVEPGGRAAGAARQSRGDHQRRSYGMVRTAVPAGTAADTSGTYSMMAPSRPGCAIA